jgi:hypothetical protein
MWRVKVLSPHFNFIDKRVRDKNSLQFRNYRLKLKTSSPL